MTDKIKKEIIKELKEEIIKRKNKDILKIEKINEELIKDKINELTKKINELTKKYIEHKIEIDKDKYKVKWSQYHHDITEKNKNFKIEINKEKSKIYRLNNKLKVNKKLQKDIINSI